MFVPSTVRPLVLSIIASITAMLWPFFSATVRTIALTAEVIFFSYVSVIFSTPSPPGETMMGAAAPMTLSGAM